MSREEFWGVLGLGVDWSGSYVLVGLSCNIGDACSMLSHTCQS